MLKDKGKKTTKERESREIVVFGDRAGEKRQQKM